METTASVKTKCDGCQASLGESYPNKRGAMSLSLKDGQDKDGYDIYHRYDFCGEGCLKDFLNTRGKTAKGSEARMEVDMGKSPVFAQFQTATASIKDK